MLALGIVADRGTGIVAYGRAWLFGWVEAHQGDPMMRVT
jgi:hypothetical protein